MAERGEIPLAITGDGVRMGPRPPEPIRVRCEGSCHPPAGAITHHHRGPGPTDCCELGLCSMCGEPKVLGEGLVPEHDRDDVISMIDRGDFK